MTINTENIRPDAERNTIFSIFNFNMNTFVNILTIFYFPIC